jgi:hypothetical protein
MAPEALSDDARVGTSADAYAYGVLAWELLERKKPWTGKSQHQIHNAIVQGERLPRPLSPAVPELADLALECFGVAAERPTLHALETMLDELLSTDERDLDTLRARLAEAQRGDADAYEDAWDAYASDPCCGEMLELCALLAKKRAETPRQPESCKSIDDLRSLAKSVRDAFHDELRAVVTRVGGTYITADTKARARCAEKSSREYEGDVCRIVDVERATALFTSVPKLHEGVRQLSQLGGDLLVVRVKDSFGEPKPSGWRCIYFNIKHVPSGMVAEVQATFDRIKINGRSHHIYTLLRCLERGVELAPRNKVVAEQQRSEAKAARAAEEQERRHEVAAAAEAREKLRAAEARAADAEEPAARAPQVRTRAPTPSNPTRVASSIDDAEIAAKDGAFGPLIFFLKDGTAEDTRKRAAAALAQSAIDADNNIAIVKQGAVPPLIDVARGGSADAKEQAVRAQWNLSERADHQVSIFEAAAAAPLIDILENGADNAKAAAAGALRRLAWN